MGIGDWAQSPIPNLKFKNLSILNYLIILISIFKFNYLFKEIVKIAYLNNKLFFKSA